MSKKTADLLNLSARKKESWKFFNQIAPTYDRVNRILSMGIDILWRKNFCRNLPNRKDLLCLDLATGTGDVAIELARDVRVKHIEATDLSKEMIKIGKKKVNKNKHGHKITMKVADGVDIPSPDSSFDIVTVGFGIRNFGDYRKSLKNMARVLKPDGQVMILEFSLPTNRAIRSGYLFYFRSILPRVGNLLSGHKDAYTYLNKTVEDFPYGDIFIKEMKKAGFNKVESKNLSFGIATIYIASKS